MYVYISKCMYMNVSACISVWVCSIGVTYMYICTWMCVHNSIKRLSKQDNIDNKIEKNRIRIKNLIRPTILFRDINLS